MIKIITTVGTSIITNFRSNEVQRAIKKVTNNNNANIDTLYDAILEYPDKSDIDELSSIISSFFLTNMTKKSDCWEYSKTPTALNIHCCAEVYSIAEIIKQNKDEVFEIELITTDTVIAKVAAELIAIALNKLDIKIQKVQIHNVLDLQVENGEEFKDSGFNNLIKCYDNIIETVKKHDYTTKFILNITGGYKGIIPLSTVYGLITGISINYIYENSNSLVVLENLPLTFDWTITELVGPYLDTYKFNEFRKDESIMAMLRQYGFINRSNNISTFGFLFKRVLELTQPEGKTSLGMLVEFKLYEYYYQFDKNVRQNYCVSRSIYIKDNFPPKYPLKGNEIDILLEEKGNNPIFNNMWHHSTKNQIKPIKNRYITNEIKGFWQVKSGNNLVQFKAFIKLLKENWEQPKEIRYITWELIRVNLPSVNESQIKDTLLIMKRYVIDELGADLFKPYLLTLRIDPKKDNPYVDMMQRSINQNDFKLIQL
jgi:putative CRISPR-associated protein (TIGR02619 family)